MKPNWYTLAVFAVVCAGLIGAHFAGLTDLSKLLLSMLGALATALFPQLAAKDGST